MQIPQFQSPPPQFVYQISQPIGGQQNSQNSNNTNKKILGRIKTFISLYKEKASDKTATLSLIVSITALAISGLVYWQNFDLVDSAADSANAAYISANAAQQSVCQQENSNDIAFKSYKSSDTISKRSLGAQITSLEETQKQFEISNRPFLQVLPKTVIFNLDNLDSAQIIFTIANLGNYPIRILSSKVGTVYSNNIPDFNLIRQEFTMNTYLVKDAPTELMYPMPEAIPYLKDSLNTKRWKGYCFGSFKYQDLSKKDKKIYQYYFIIEKTYNEYGIHFKENKNVEL